MSIPTYTFYNSVPAAADAPADDQPLMLINNASIYSWSDVDHYTYNKSGMNGIHRQWRMLNQSVPSILLANSTTGWAQNDTRNNLSQLVTTTGTAVSPNVFQLTSMDNTNFGTFGTYAAYGSPPSGFSFQIGGWTFLPGPANGGLIVQYGSVYSNSPGNFNDGKSGTISFPRAFPTDVFLVVAQPLYNTSGPSSEGVGTVIIQYNNATQPTAAAFNYLFRTVSGGYTGFSWYAIGN
jgi:hypothetical protein